MTSERISRARGYVADADIGPEPARRRDGATVDLALQSGKQQAAVVGSEIVSFGSAVDSPWRQDLVNSSLLAQLVAKKQVPDPTRIFDWYGVYFDTLKQLGWAVQDEAFAVYVESSRNFEAHQAILKVATALLGPATTSLALVTTTLEALQSMNSDTPWLTLFERETQATRASRFQVSVVEQAPGGELSVSLLAFGLEAESSLTQVLFFKSLASQVTLRHCSGRVAIATDVLAGVREPLKEKVVGFSRDFVKTLDL